MRFTVIIPSWNRPSRLRASLEGIARLDYPREEFEVVVVDDGSPQPLEDVVLENPLPEPVAIRFLRQRNSGPASARNLGAAGARGEWLVFIDDDCIPHPGWLRKMDEAARNHPAHLLGGTVRNGCPANTYAVVNQHLLYLVTGWLLKARDPLRFFASNNMAVSRREFEQIGGFNPSFRLAGGEDREFCARWVAAGRELLHVPDACIDHHHPQTLRTFLSMHSRYGRGAAQLHRARGTSPVQAFASGLHWNLFKHGWRSGESVAQGLIVAGMVLLAQAATAAGFIAGRLARKKPLQ